MDDGFMTTTKDNAMNNPSLADKLATALRGAMATLESLRAKQPILDHMPSNFGLKHGRDALAEFDALQAGGGSTPQPSPDKLVGALRAIRARITGEFDDPDLLAYGPLSHTNGDCMEIASRALKDHEAQAVAPTLAKRVAAYNDALNAMEATPNGDDYNNLLAILNDGASLLPHTSGR